MHHKILRHLRANLVAWIALLLAIGGGGYALAASGSKTIHGCVLNKARVLLVKTRCGRGQRPLVWNAQGPRGPVGAKGNTGATGPQGAAPPSAWAIVNNSGQAEPSDGITASRISTGTYQVTVTAAACANKESVPVVSVSDGNPPAGQPSGTFPVAWVGDSAGGSFTVFTGIVTNGVFTATDRTFNVQDVCG
jgi:hypothetical protein